MKFGSLAVNSSKMLINFASMLKNFHNLDLRGILGIGLVMWREIGWS